MSKDKQIEEKTCKSCIHYEECRKTFLRAKAKGAWKSTTEEEYFGSSVRYCDFFADKDIYRKSEDVAREIFEEIEQEIKNHGICYAQRKIAELKKKYTEGE